MKQDQFWGSSDPYFRGLQELLLNTLALSLPQLVYLPQMIEQKTLDLNGGPSRDRTEDLLIKSYMV